MADKRIKEVSEEDLEGIIIKGEKSYVLHNRGDRKVITPKNAIKLIESMDIEAHNEAFLQKVISELEEYGEDGYNAFDFDRDGIHRNGTELSEMGYNAKGWKIAPTYGEAETKVSSPFNRYTGTNFDLDGFDRNGFDAEGYDRNGYNVDGYGKDGYDSKGWSSKSLHRDTGTEYDSDGFNINGYDKDGYDREGKNKDGKTREELDGQKNQQRKNFLGLIDLAKGYATGEVTIEDYLMNHKISLEELIVFAKKQNLGRDTIVGLQRKKAEYNQYKKVFNKAEYFKNKTTINGIEVTEEMVDKVLDYLKSSGRYLSAKIVHEHIREFVNGNLSLDEPDEKQAEPHVNEKGEIIRPEGSTKDIDIPECPFTIGTDVIESAKGIAGKETASSVKKGNTEIRSGYKELENPEQQIEDYKNLDD